MCVVSPLCFAVSNPPWVCNDDPGGRCCRPRIGYRRAGVRDATQRDARMQEDQAVPFPMRQFVVV